MPRLRLLLAACLCMLAVPAAASAASTFRWGVAAGDVRSGSAILWTKAATPGPVTLHVDERRSLRSTPIRLRARRSDDSTIRVIVTGLRPAQRYFFRFRRESNGSRSEIGTFRTAPRANADVPVRFTWSGDQDATPRPGERKPYWNDLGVLGRMARSGGDFGVLMGDTIYSDSEVPGVEGKVQALTVPAKWAKYRLIRDQANARRFMRSSATYWHWDDHEFINDFSPQEDRHRATGGAIVDLDGRTLYRRGRQAFLDYSPVRSGELGLYRTFRWGRNVELFFLDQRSFRSAKATDACINPQTGGPDLAPTGPQATRDAFSIVVPSLAQPVAQSCLDAIRSPQRTMLGSRQWARFQRDIRASTATWKVVMTEMEAKQYYVNPYDRWEGYESDRQRLLGLLRTVPNAVLLATDVHANLGVDARLQTLEPGGPVDSGVFEMSTGPVATKNFNLEVSDTVGNPSVGDLVSSAFLKPAPPNGIGMPCVATKVFSYGEVTANARTFRIQPRDADGRPVRQDDGSPCGPFTLTAR